MTRSRLHCVTGTSVDGSVLFLRIGGVDRALKLHTTLFRFANDCNPEGGLGRRITASGRLLPHADTMAAIDSCRPTAACRQRQLRGSQIAKVLPRQVRISLAEMAGCHNRKND